MPRRSDINRLLRRVVPEQRQGQLLHHGGVYRLQDHAVVFPENANRPTNADKRRFGVVVTSREALLQRPRVVQVAPASTRVDLAGPLDLVVEPQEVYGLPKRTALMSSLTQPILTEHLGKKVGRLVGPDFYNLLRLLAQAHGVPFGQPLEEATRMPPPKRGS